MMAGICGDDGDDSSLLPLTLMNVSVRRGESDFSMSSVSFNLSNPYFVPDETREGRHLIAPRLVSASSDEHERSRSWSRSGENLRLSSMGNASRDIESLVGDMSLRWSTYETSGSNRDDVLQNMMDESLFNVMAESTTRAAAAPRRGRGGAATFGSSKRWQTLADRNLRLSLFRFEESSFTLGEGNAVSERSSSYDADRSEFLSGGSDGTKSNCCDDHGEMASAETEVFRGLRLRSTDEDDRFDESSLSLNSDRKVWSSVDERKTEDVRRRSCAETVRKRNGIRDAKSLVHEQEGTSRNVTPFLLRAMDNPMRRTPPAA